MTIGQKIEYLRIRARMTQRELARQLKVSPSTICLWEKDETVPRMHKLQLLANLFGVKIGYFVQDVEVIKEDEIVALYVSLNDEGKERLLEFGHMLLNNGYIKNHTVSVGNQAI